MPHTRNRACLELLIKKIRFAPVVALQGARQTGKSFLVRELLKKEMAQLVYKTFDEDFIKNFAESNPDTFLSQNEPSKGPLVIDEAQKVPKIFDAVKFKVDEQRRPGRFVLLGSTEFSKMTQIRESLTGRLSRIRIYPMNLAEAYELPANQQKLPFHLNLKPRITRKQLLDHLERGGLPAIFTIRSATERSSFLQDWLELTCFRDATLFPKLKINGELCLRILKLIATLAEPNAASLAKELRTDPRKIKTHLAVLETLFAIHRLDPHPFGTGKSIYFLCDVALANHLGANFERRLHTWLVQEFQSQRANRDDRESELFYYRSPKGRWLHMIHETQDQTAALKIFPEERIFDRDAELLLSFKLKCSATRKKPVTLVGLGFDTCSLGPRAQVKVYPWNALG